MNREQYLMAYLFLPLTFALVAFGAQSGTGPSKELEPCIQGDDIASGPIPNQAMEAEL